ncbi:MAG TPA: aminotransferase class IV, partial [Synergistales bacterium]|nr:aminotransferase class IV [Synergistales bacterium]
KMGGNYAASLMPHELAKRRGFADCVYLDPATHTKIEEVGAANFFGITRDGRLSLPVRRRSFPASPGSPSWRWRGGTSA